MEDLVLKCAEFGILGVITLLLPTKGLTALNAITQATTALTESISKLTEKVSSLDIKLETLKYQIEGLEKRIDKLEENSSRNFNELRTLITERIRSKKVGVEK